MVETWFAKDYLRHLFQEKPYRLRLRATLTNGGGSINFGKIVARKPISKARYAIGIWRNTAWKCLHQTRQKLGNEFHYDDRQNGILQLFGPDYLSGTLREHFETLRGQGADIHWLEGAALYQQEPALRMRLTRVWCALRYGGRGR